MRRPDAVEGWILPLSVAGVAAIVFVDWLTPVGVVVGILLVIPILLASLTDDTRAVWLVAGSAAVGFVMAAALGRGPIAPAAVWVPNRILAFLTIPAAGALALFLQGRRIRLERAQHEALASSDLNRLLLSLLAHDLRAPIGTAIQAIDYLAAGHAAEARDSELAADVRNRLLRSLGTIDNILSVVSSVRGKSEGASSERSVRTGTQIAEEVEAEAMSFADEARARGKSLHVAVTGDDSTAYSVDLLVLRQSVAILVDNAVRHAVAGAVHARGEVLQGNLTLRIEDEGPGLRAARSDELAGSGLGLELCGALVSRSGGTLRVARDDASGTAFELRMPFSRAS